jgi:hypothetical protein
VSPANRLGSGGHVEIGIGEFEAFGGSRLIRERLQDIILRGERKGAAEDKREEAAEIAEAKRGHDYFLKYIHAAKASRSTVMIQSMPCLPLSFSCAI